jgi:hypothetical protein
MSQRTSSSQSEKQYYLITNVVAKTDSEVDLKAGSWKEPYTINDSDLMFDGKPLNMLYEENRWVAEHQKGEKAGSRDAHSSGGEVSDLIT